MVNELLTDLENTDTTDGSDHLVTPPSVRGEQAVSGDMPHPESDDDTLLNSHQVGLRLDETEENPLPLNMAADINNAERSRHGSLDIHDDNHR